MNEVNVPQVHLDPTILNLLRILSAAKDRQGGRESESCSKGCEACALAQRIFEGPGSFGDGDRAVNGESQRERIIRQTRPARREKKGKRK